LLLAAIAGLMLAGVILSLAASPPVATRIGLDPFHFFNRHVLFLLPSLIAGAFRHLAKFRLSRFPPFLDESRISSEPSAPASHKRMAISWTSLSPISVAYTFQM